MTNQTVVFSLDCSHYPYDYKLPNTQVRGHKLACIVFTLKTVSVPSVRLSLNIRLISHLIGNTETMAEPKNRLSQQTPPGPLYSQYQCFTHAQRHEVDKASSESHSPANADAIAATKKLNVTAGPATVLATAPASTQTPSPSVLPTPSAVRSIRPKHRSSFVVVSLPSSCLQRRSAANIRPQLICGRVNFNN